MCIPRARKGKYSPFCINGSNEAESEPEEHPESLFWDQKVRCRSWYLQEAHSSLLTMSKDVNGKIPLVLCLVSRAVNQVSKVAVAATDKPFTKISGEKTCN